MTLYQSPDTILTLEQVAPGPLSIRAKALVFVDSASRHLHTELERLAATPLAVLIQGETGTGKELLARQLHSASQRPGPFVSINCGALNKGRAEEELFGTQLQVLPSGRTGWYGAANGGTLYLDEIGDLPRALQAKLLTALQTHEIRPVGTGHYTPVDVRLIASSSFDLARAVQAGTFNAHLHEYLTDGLLPVPPLRLRVADILPLAEYFLAIHAQRLELPLPAFDEGAISRLQAHRWPGNIRELEQVVHLALLTSQNGLISEQDLHLV